MHNSRSYALAVAVFMAVGLVLTACSFVVEVDGTAHDVRVYVPTRDAPTGSDTPTPTRTPTATHTATPSATVTPTPAATDTPLYGTDAPPPDTLTSTPSATVTPVFPTPTPDTLPTVTPGPSSTPVPPPDDQLCHVASNYNMRIRSGPSTSYPQVDLLPSETRAVVVALWIQAGEGSANREEWAQLGEGRWLAVWIQGDQLAFLDDAPPCWELPRDGPGSVPQPQTALGIRTVPGASGFEAMYPILDAKGIPYGVSPYASIDYCTAALDAGGLCVIRPGAPDCPANMYTSDPRTNALDFMKHAALYASILKGRDNAWIEPLNECMGSPDTTQHYAWWAEWMSAYIDEAARLGWPPLALPGLPPGHGDELMFSTWKPVMQKLAAHNGLFSMHDYTFISQTGLCTCDEWEACRHLHNYNLMQEQGYSIPYTITEAARWSGNAPVDEADFACWFEQVRRHGFVHSAWLWVGGYHSTWPRANLDGHYVSIAERVQ